MTGDEMRYCEHKLIEKVKTEVEIILNEKDGKYYLGDGIFKTHYISKDLAQVKVFLRAIKNTIVEENWDFWRVAFSVQKFFKRSTKGW